MTARVMCRNETVCRQRSSRATGAPTLHVTSRSSADDGAGLVFCDWPSMSLETTTRMLAPFLEAYGPEDLDRIPYGIVKLDATGTVRACNRAESENAGHITSPVGRHYFLDVAPSAAVPEFYGSFVLALAQEQFDETFAFTFACGMLPRRVQVRMYYSARCGSLWIFTARPDGGALAADDDDLTLRLGNVAA